MATAEPGSLPRPPTGSGAIAPGYRADLLVLPDLETFRARARAEGRRGRLAEIPSVPVPGLGAPAPSGSRRSPAADLRIPWQRRPARVIGLVPDQIVTEALVERADGRGRLRASPTLRATSPRSPSSSATSATGPGRARLRARLRPRSAAPSPRRVAHDAHNLIVVGVDDDAMAGGRAGWSSSAAGIVVVDERRVARRAAAAGCGAAVRPAARRGARAEPRRSTPLHGRSACTFPHPFQVLAFLALSVIPSLKITDRGLVDVDRFELVPLASEPARGLPHGDFTLLAPTPLPPHQAAGTFT